MTSVIEDATLLGPAQFGLVLVGGSTVAKHEDALSPSEIVQFLDCPRRWGWERLDGVVVERGNSAAELGKAVHSQGEGWFRFQKLPDHTTVPGMIFETGIHHWPAPQNVDLVEEHLHVRTPVAIYHGFQDIGFVDAETGRRVVGDHKTTSNFRWAKSAEDLRTDVQAIVYAAMNMARFSVDEVELRWVYYRTTKPYKSMRVLDENKRPIVVDAKHVERVFREKIDPAAARMLEIYASGATGKDLEPNANHCDAYGGCPHRDRCNLSSEEKMRSYMAQETLRERMLRKVGVNPPEAAKAPAPGTVPVSTAPATTPAPTAAPAQPGGTLAARMRARADAAPIQTDHSTIALPKETAAAPKVTPPPAGNLAARMAAKVQAATSPAPRPAPEPAPHVPGVPAVEPASAVTTVHMAAPVQPAETRAPAPVAVPGMAYTLLIDATLERSGSSWAFVRAADIVERAHTWVRQNVKDKDNALVPDFRCVEFGRGPGILAAKVREILTSEPFTVPTAVILHTANDAERACVEAFVATASTIVRGAR